MLSLLQFSHIRLITLVWLEKLKMFLLWPCCQQPMLNIMLSGEAEHALFFWTNTLFLVTSKRSIRGPLFSASSGNGIEISVRACMTNNTDVFLTYFYRIFTNVMMSAWRPQLHVCARHGQYMQYAGVNVLNP